MHNMKQLRKEKGLSQRELAGLLNISQQSVYKYESGQSMPNVETLREISEFFDTSIDYLISSEYDSQRLHDRLRLTQDELLLIQSYRKLSNQTKRMVRNVATKLVPRAD